MSTNKTPSTLVDWFDTPLGQSLYCAEEERIHSTIAQLKSQHALQLGTLTRTHSLLKASKAKTQLLLDANLHDTPSGLRAHPEAIPLEQNSFDLVLMPHTLDFCSNPHAVLREAHRILSPEGHVVIIGFNPYSLWGAWRACLRNSERFPWCGNRISLSRLKDWLALLDFQCAQGRMIYYRPPMHSEKWRARLAVLDKMGDRWWPLLAAVYLFVAKKRVIGVTPLRPAWRGKKIASPRLIYPAIRQMRHQSSCRRLKYG